MAVLDVAPVRVSTAEVVMRNIRGLAAAQGFTQLDVARALGMSQSAVTTRWKGRAKWQLEELDSVAQVLGVSVTDLVTPSPFTNLHPRQDSNL